jgi:hypothetical protein
MDFVDGQTIVYSVVTALQLLCLLFSVWADLRSRRAPEKPPALMQQASNPTMGFNGGGEIKLFTPRAAGAAAANGSNSTVSKTSSTPPPPRTDKGLWHYMRRASLLTSAALQVLVVDVGGARGVYSWATSSCLFLFIQTMLAVQTSLWIFYTARALYRQLHATPPRFFTSTVWAVPPVYFVCVEGCQLIYFLRRAAVEPDADGHINTGWGRQFMALTNVFAIATALLYSALISYLYFSLRSQLTAFLHATSSGQTVVTDTSHVHRALRTLAITTGVAVSCLLGIVAALTSSAVDQYTTPDSIDVNELPTQFDLSATRYLLIVILQTLSTWMCLPDAVLLRRAGFTMCVAQPNNPNPTPSANNPNASVNPSATANASAQVGSGKRVAPASPASPPTASPALPPAAAAAAR